MSDKNDEMFFDEEFMKSLQTDFLDQVGFMLDECEESYLKLSDPDHRTEELGKIFRLAHSIKGTGGVAGFHDFAAFAHSVEDLLTVLRNHPHVVDEKIISLLLEAGDAFKKRIKELKEGDRNPWNADELKSRILAVVHKIKPPEPEAVVELPEIPVPEPVRAEIPVPELPVTAAPVAAAVFNKSETEEHVKKTTSEKDTSPKKESVALVRVDPSRIDSVLDLVGELIIIKGQLMEECAHLKGERSSEILSLLDKTARDLQGKTLAMRLTSIKPLFLRMQRVVRDTSISVGKPVEFSTEGDEIEIDRSMIEMLADPIMHIVRNAVDHGLESPEERLKSGKSSAGRIQLSARHSGGRVVIEIQDDGKGIDRARVLKKAIERGLRDEAEAARMVPEEIFQLLFEPGFSTAESVTDISGRGVGLDVARTNLEKLRGQLSVESEPGKGSIFRISVPLTTAITDGIIVAVEGQRFVLPMSSILEIVNLQESEIFEASGNQGIGQSMAMIRGESVAILPLTHALNAGRKILPPVSSRLAAEPAPAERNRKRRTAIVIENARFPVAVIVDHVLGQSQVVVKPLGDRFDSSVGLAGASIMGDGKIALVIDVDAMINHVKSIKIASPNSANKVTSKVS